jgi:predicted ester cyclase
MSAEARALVERFAEICSGHDLSVLDEVVHPTDYRQQDPSIPPGIETTRGAIQELLDALPDLVVTVEQVAAQDDRVIAVCRWSGTHRGPLYGVAPSGEPLAFHAAECWQIRDGRFVEHWGFDDLSAALIPTQEA